MDDRKTWYVVDENNTLLTLTAPRAPWWFCTGNSWFDSPEEAIARRLQSIQGEVKSARESLERAEVKMMEFRRAFEGE
jgi:hypothetical protein